MFDRPFIIPALIILLISVPLVTGIIPKNRFYGIRNKKTLSDNYFWYKGNRFGCWMLITASLTYMLTAAAFPYNKAAVDNFSIWLIPFGVLVLSMTGSLVITSLYIKRL
ncbi:MAG: SdpI family protein [Nitrospirota bacterium]